MLRHLSVRTYSKRQILGQYSVRSAALFGLFLILFMSKTTIEKNCAMPTKKQLVFIRFNPLQPTNLCGIMTLPNVQSCPLL